REAGIRLAGLPLPARTGAEADPRRPQGDPMSSESYHEPPELIREETKELHRAIVSLIEELEAIDWYQQRADAASDDHLRSILIHNRNEEVEHAMMTLEWLRRREPEFDRQARTYLFTEGPITAIEEAVEGGGGAELPATGGKRSGLGIGSLK